MSEVTFPPLFAFRADPLADSNAFSLASARVQSSLKSPSTAVFPSASSAGYAHYPERTIVSSYVDSQNAYGATVRTDWIVWVAKSGGKFTACQIVSLETRR